MSYGKKAAAQVVLLMAGAVGSPEYVMVTLALRIGKLFWIFTTLTCNRPLEESSVEAVRMGFGME